MAKVLLGNIMGPKGDTGPQGPIGESGPQGVAGEAGHTPVKGEDYFTEEDILAMLEHFAPAGYGIGDAETKQHILLADVDSTFVSGLYWVSCSGTTVNDKLFNYALLRVTCMGSTLCIHELFPLGHPMMLIRHCDGGTWPAGWGLITWNSTTTLGGD